MLHKVFTFLITQRRSLCSANYKNYPDLLNVKENIQEYMWYLVTWFVFQGQQDVLGGNCRVRRVSNTKQSRYGIGLQLLSPSWRPGDLLKLAQLKVILRETRKVYTDTI